MLIPWYTNLDNSWKQLPILLDAQSKREAIALANKDLEIEAVKAERDQYLKERNEARDQLKFQPLIHALFILGGGAAGYGLGKITK